MTTESFPAAGNVRPISAGRRSGHHAFRALRVRQLEFSTRLHAAASRVRPDLKDAAAGLRHLADLYEHHAVYYPDLPIPSKNSAPWRVGPSSSFGASGSPALACAEY